MLFLSKRILGSDTTTIPLTPTSIDNMTYVKLSNGIYDCLYITNNVIDEVSVSCKKEFDFDTILHADFNNNTNAGNVDWSLDTVSEIIIKRRKKSDFKWMTIAVKEVNKLEDFFISKNDYTNASNVEYEYAIVPILNSGEGLYYTTFVESKFNSMFLVEKDTMIGTPITDGFCDTTRRIPSSLTETINNQYPTYVRNTKANYDKGTCKGNFLEMEEDECNFDTDDKTRVPYQLRAMDFVADGMPKILKLPDGRIWLIEVTGDPTDTADQKYNIRYINFEWAQIGNHESEKDLYYSGLSDIDEKWWDIHGNSI